MGDRGGWGPGAPPGGWGGPPRTQVQQVPLKSHLFRDFFFAVDAKGPGQGLGLWT